MIVVNARFLTQPVTGVQRFAIEISKVLKTLYNNELVFVSPADILQTTIATELGAITVGKNKGTIWEQVDLRNYLNANNKPLLINFCNTGVLFYSRQVVTIHDMSYKVNPKWFSRGFYLWYNYLIPQIAKSSLKILTVSHSAKKDIVSFLKITPDKIKVIYNSSYLNTNNNFERTIKEKYILTVSSLDPRKNLINLVKAFKLIDNEASLIIVGLKSANFNNALGAEALNKNIVLKGYVSDIELESLIKNAAVFVYLSFYEGFGLPPIEAMGLGCPVIVSDIAAHKEICADAAIYTDPFNIIDIKNKINLVLNNDKLKQELITAGKKNIKRFDWQKSAREVFNSINEIV
jgi:glycosyltransferase involved in cell wall biosynthesis